MYIWTSSSFIFTCICLSQFELAIFVAISDAHKYHYHYILYSSFDLFCQILIKTPLIFALIARSQIHMFICPILSELMNLEQMSRCNLENLRRSCCCCCCYISLLSLLLLLLKQPAAQHSAQHTQLPLPHRAPSSFILTNIRFEMYHKNQHKFKYMDLPTLLIRLRLLSVYV